VIENAATQNRMGNALQRELRANSLIARGSVDEKLI